MFNYRRYELAQYRLHVALLRYSQCYSGYRARSDLLLLGTG